MELWDRLGSYKKFKRTESHQEDGDSFLQDGNFQKAVEWVNSRKPQNVFVRQVELDPYNRDFRDMLEKESLFDYERIDKICQEDLLSSQGSCCAALAGQDNSPSFSYQHQH